MCFFSYSSFLSSVDFSNAEFFDYASFNSSRFLDNAYFDNVKFSDEVDFSNTTFLQTTSFSKAIFLNKAYFSNSGFTRITFSNAIFSDEVNFFITTFSGYANFNNISFSKVVKFSYSTFTSVSDFSNSSFLSSVDFSNAEFSARVDYMFTTFSNSVDFSEVKFLSKVDFSKTIFNDTSNFTRTKFADETYFSCRFYGLTYFNYVTFGKPNEVRFEVEDMSLVSFINTDITEIRFSGKTSWNKDRRQLKVVEEEKLEVELDYCSTKGSNLEEILSVYRNLRENYEYRRRYDEAGKFFIREMELKRKYREDLLAIRNIEDKIETVYQIKKNCWFRRNIFSLTGWYHLLSNYGESLWRPTVAGIVIVFLFSLLFVTQSNPYQEPFSNIFSTTNNTTTATTINKNNNVSNQNAIHKTNVSNTITADTNSSRFIGLEK
ncbi:MAG: pentapeptide repeat-containing protein [Candidatus Nitrosocosmicus sp.]